MSSPSHALDFLSHSKDIAAEAPQEQAMTNSAHAMEFFPSAAPSASVTPRWSLKAAVAFLALALVVLPLMLVASVLGVGAHRG